MRTPREFWIDSTLKVWLADPHADDAIHVREVLPDEVTDTDMCGDGENEMNNQRRLICIRKGARPCPLPGCLDECHDDKTRIITDTELTQDQIARFWIRVKDVGNCWEFEGLSTQGYGQVMFNGKNRRAHVVAYELLKGKVPEGLVLDHTCRNRACVNPAHLEPVTNKENVLMGEGITAKNIEKTHCAKGHEYNSETLYIWKGHRQCRKCKSEYENTRRKNKSPREAIDAAMKENE